MNEWYRLFFPFINPVMYLTVMIHKLLASNFRCKCRKWPERWKSSGSPLCVEKYVTTIFGDTDLKS